MDTPTCLIDAVRYFSDLTVCEEYMASIRWPRGEPCCPECESKRIGTIASRRLLRCKECRRQFSHKVGTIFEDSPLGLDKWFVAVWAIANCKNGISSHELGRAIDVTQKTAWFMLHRIRKAMEAESFDKFDGPAEADTTYVGGAAANMHKDRKDKIGGTYVAVAPFHLTRYVAEQVFRFNARKGTDADRFRAVLAQVFGRRLTWRVLCGVDGAGFMTLE